MRKINLVYSILVLVGLAVAGWSISYTPAAAGGGCVDDATSKCRH
jgi:hypothetical protein